MNFQLPATTNAAAAPTGGFSFGLTSTPAAGAAGGAKPPTFSFGSTGGGDAGTAKPLGLGTATTAAPTIGGGLGSGFFSQPAATAAATQAPASGLSAALAAPIATSAAVPSFAASTATPSFGAPAAAPSFGAPAGTPGFGAPAATPSFGAPAAVPSFGASAAVPSFGAATAQPAATTAATLTLSKQPAAAAAAPTLGMPTSSAASLAPSSTTSTGGFASLTTATKTTNSAPAAAAPVTASQVSYNQMEEHINKWTLELEEQEKVFTDQATQINAWDKILVSNNQKILELNDAVQKVKSDQQTLEHELEFIATQHKELEESIVPLQKEFMKIPQVDMERSQTYLMVENLDTQLKQMSEDLKEIIDNLNESNKGQDNTDPIIQIGKILNAHMSSLQWIESSTANIGNKLDDITKMHESFKRDSERSFRSAYYN